MERNTIDKIRENLRLQQVYNVMLRYGWDYLFDRWDLVSTFRHSLQAWAWQVPVDDLESVPAPVKTRMMLEELGPTYVKMGQIVSSQSSVIPPDWAYQLELLQSDVPPFPDDQVIQTIIDELGEPPEKLYASFELKPFAAASTAQVHRAFLEDGTLVAVKIQRPNIYNQMKADIGIMQNAARVVNARSVFARSIDLAGMVDQFGSSVLRELNYDGEAYNAFRLAKNMENIPGVYIPHVYSQLSTSKILTLEFVKGVKISNIEALQAAGFDLNLLAKNVITALVKQLLIDGFFHADPHPGNVLVKLETGDIYFLDTGMVGELNLQQRLNLIQLIFAIQQVDILGMAQILRSMSEPFKENVDDQRFYHDFERVVGRYFYMGKNAAFAELVSTAMNLLREHGLRLNPNLTMAIKALMQAEAISTALAPEGGLLADGVAIIREQGLQVITADRILEEGKKQLMTGAREVFKQLPDLSIASMSWLKQYKKGRFEVTVNTSELAKEVNKITRIGRQAVVAIILVGMIIGSAIATAAIAFSDQTSTVWVNIQRFSYLAFIFSMVIATIIILRLVWRWIRGKNPDED